MISTIILLIFFLVSTRRQSFKSIFLRIATITDRKQEMRKCKNEFRNVFLLFFLLLCFVLDIARVWMWKSIMTIYTSVILIILGKNMKNNGN